MMKHDRKRPVTLEDILRLKRAERPTAEFWNQFDRELRVKQLAALVEQRPWWRTISLGRVLAGVRRFHLPLGAAAVLVVTLVSVREYRAPNSAVLSASATQELGVPASPISVVVDAMANKPESVAVEAPISAAMVSPDSGFSAAHAVVASEVVATSLSASGVAVAMASPAVGEFKSAVTSSALFSAETLADLSVADSVLQRHSLSPSRGFETRGMSARAKPVEPLAQMKVPGGSRRSNLIASATLASTTPPVITTERASRALSDERLYDTVSRVNARGAGVLVKF